MAVEREALRDWHRLFGLLLTDFFTGSPFVVEVERDLSVQQQLLDVVIVRRGRGRFAGRLPDGLDGLRPHNLITFKSHHEALDGWAMKELVGARRRLPQARQPLAVRPAARGPVRPVRGGRPLPAQPVGASPLAAACRPGVYDCRWGTDTIRVVVAGELPREAHNAPLHLFSASPELVGFGGSAYRRRSEQTSRLLGQLFERLRGEGFAMSFTMEDFKRQYIKEHFAQLTPEERREVAGVAAAGGAARKCCSRCRRRSAGGSAAGATPGRSAAGAASGGPVRGADPAVPGPADRWAPRRAAQAAAKEVMPRRPITRNPSLASQAHRTATRTRRRVYAADNFS